MNTCGKHEEKRYQEISRATGSLSEPQGNMKNCCEALSFEPLSDQKVIGDRDWKWPEGAEKLTRCEDL